MKSTLQIVIGIVFVPLTIHATILEFLGLNQLVPDDDSSGVANQQTVNVGNIGPILDVNVTLHLSGVGADGFNGDLYALLLHESKVSVLLNRPGRDMGRAAGYGDNGLSIVLDDAAVGDVHTYRDIVSGPFPLLSALGGRWQPDGRETDPANVVTGDSRTALLGSFNGLDPNGTWTLFVADLASGGQVRLDGWALELTSPAVGVPDSGVALGWTLAATILLAETRRRYQSRRNRVITRGSLSHL